MSTPTTTTPTGELGGLTELGQALGVTRQRVSQLAAREGFPAPVVVVPATGRRHPMRLWNIDAVVAWNAARLAARGGTDGDD